MLTSKEIILKLCDNVYHKIPTSLIRYGDGEAMVLNAREDKESFERVFRGQIGYTPSYEVAERIYVNLVNAYSNCDIIGFPTERHLTHPRFKDGYWGKSKDIFIKNLGKGSLDLKHITSIDVHSEFLTNGYFKTLLDNQDTVNYVSCRNIDQQLKDTFNIKNINSYIISPEMKFSSLVDPTPHYPNQFLDVKEWIKSLKQQEKGNVCLVGAGIVGKIYCNWFRDIIGGVSMDIGSIFDHWAGLSTRGPERGVDKIDLTHKL